MKKKAVSILMSAALAAGMTAGFSANVMADDNTITFMGWYEEDEMEGVLEALNTELNGKYQVEYTYVAQTDYNNVLSTQLAAGEGPDIVADGTNFPARIKAGNVVEITGEDFLGEFNEAGFALCSDGDKMYGIPSYGWFSGIWYNKALFEENGITELPKTFDEFVKVCDTFAENGVQPLGFGLADGDTALHSLLGYLENSFYHNNEKNTDGVDFDVKFANGEENMNGKLNSSVEKWATLIEKGYINEEMLGLSNEQALSDFVAGKTAMFNGGPWQYTNLQESGMEFGMMPHLSETDGDRYMIGGPAVNFGVNVNSKNQEGAMAVLEALSSVSVQQAFVDSNVGGFSYRKGVEAEMPAEYDDVKDIINSGNIACTWDRWSVNMPSQSLFDEARAQLQGLVTGDLSVEDYLQSLDDAASSIRYQ